MNRQRWLSWHRALGLSGGIILLLLALSGSLITFEAELDAALNPGLLRVQPAARASMQSPAHAVAAARGVAGDGARLQTVVFPREANGVYVVRFAEPALRVYVDPYHAKVTGSRSGETVLELIHRLHATLLIGDLGRLVLLVVALATLISLASGIKLWWPKAGKWRQAFVYKSGAGAARRAFDLHRLGGLYLLPLTFLTALTGIWMAVPPVAELGINLVAPITQWPAAWHSQPSAAGRTPLDIDTAFAIGQREMPGTTPRQMIAPNGPDGVWRLVASRSNDPGGSHGGLHDVFIDAYSGSVVAKVQPNNFKSGDHVVSWIYPLHTGTAFDLPGRLAVFAEGLLLSLALGAGLVHWRNKRRAGRIVQERAGPPRPALANGAEPATAAAGRTAGGE